MNNYPNPTKPVFRNSKYGKRPKRQGQYIHPDRFVNQSSTVTRLDDYAPEHSFSDFGLIPSLAKNVKTKGYETPTRIQDRAILPALAGRDILGLANTGTGKTAAFVLPIIQRLIKKQSQRAIIIAPTRELAVQINDEFKGFAAGLGLYSAICVGGTSLGPQKAQLARRPQVVIGTPGRLKDLQSQGALQLKYFDVVVLDEADRMLDMGFIRDVEQILSLVAPVRQTMCFSATLPADIRRLLDAKLKDPVVIKAVVSETSDHIEQNVIKANSKDQKVKILVDLLHQPEFDKVIIFTQTKWAAQRLARDLADKGFRADAIHGNKSQPQRQRTLQAFKSGKIAILVATDVAARGLDIPKVSHVINFDQPTTYEDYTHRIGRTGRAGETGHALTFVAD